MPRIQDPSLPLWRIDSGRKDAESLTRQEARKIDQAGNGDGKVSLSEVDAYEAKLVAVMGSPTFSAWTDPTHDPVKKEAWVENNTVYYVREAVTQPHSLVEDVVRRNFGPALETAAALWWFGPH